MNVERSSWNISQGNWHRAVAEMRRMDVKRKQLKSIAFKCATIMPTLQETAGGSESSNI